MSDANELISPASQASGRERGAEEKTRQILGGARRVFLADGFDGASMNDIAREAGVSKGTLYVYFPSKNALFAAYVRDDRLRQAEQMVPYTSKAALEDALVTIGMNVMNAMLTPAHIAQLRIVTAAASKFPEIGRAFYEAGPEYGEHRLAAFLASRAENGGLVIADLPAASTHFLNLIQGNMLRRALFCTDEAFTSEEIESTVKTGVDVFLKVYRKS